MGAKVTFDPVTRIIQVTQAPDVNGDVLLDVKADLYSDGKEDWVATESLRRVIFPIRSVGGDPLPGSQELGATFFLRSDWKIKPYDASHRLTINGNMYSEDGEDFMLDTDGTHTVRVMQQVSPLVSAILQQQHEIEDASFGGFVTLDAVNGQPGTAYPLGNRANPVNNWTDLLVIAADRGLHDAHVHGNYTFGPTDVLDGMRIYGDNDLLSTFMFTSGCSTAATELVDASLCGVLSGLTHIEHCKLGESVDLEGLEGHAEFCGFAGTMKLGGAWTASWCVSDVPGMATPIVDFVGPGTSLSNRSYSGGFEAVNMTDSTNKCTVEFVAGQGIVGVSNTDGLISLRGVFNPIINSGGTVVDLLSQLSKREIAATFASVHISLAEGATDLDLGVWMDAGVGWRNDLDDISVDVCLRDGTVVDSLGSGTGGGAPENGTWSFTGDKSQLTANVPYVLVATATKGAEKWYGNRGFVKGT